MAESNKSPAHEAKRNENGNIVVKCGNGKNFWQEKWRKEMEDTKKKKKAKTK